MENFAYISVLSTESYLIGVLALAKSLKKVNSKFPFYVVITDAISIEIENLLKNRNINILRTSSISLPKIIKERNDKGTFSHWTYTFDKLLIFELTQFDKIVYLDADIYIRKNIDLLFEKPHMSTTPNRKYGPNATIPPELISGLLVIEPQNGLLQSFLNILSTISEKRDSIGDQDILQEYYTNWPNQPKLHLDLKYNAFFTYLDYYTTYCNYSIDDIYIFHFLLSKKPWNFSKFTSKEYIQYLNDRVSFLYTKYKSHELENCIKSGNNSKELIISEYFDLLEECKY